MFSEQCKRCEREKSKINIGLLYCCAAIVNGRSKGSPSRDYFPFQRSQSVRRGSIIYQMGHNISMLSELASRCNQCHSRGSFTKTESHRSLRCALSDVLNRSAILQAPDSPKPWKPYILACQRRTSGSKLPKSPCVSSRELCRGSVYWLTAYPVQHGMLCLRNYASLSLTTLQCSSDTQMCISIFLNRGVISICILPESWIVRFLVTYKQGKATFSK